MNDNHIKFEVSLHFGGIWSTVRRAGGSITHADVIVSVKTRQIKNMHVGVLPNCS